MQTSKRKAYLEIVFLLVVIVMAGWFARSAYMRFYRMAYPVHYREEVLAYSAENGLPPELVFAVIRTESGFDPLAHSSVGARGLMQITGDTFDWAQFRQGEAGQLDHELLYQPDLNIRYGTVILRVLLEEFETTENALCAYHAGWGTVQRWLKDPDTSKDGQMLDHIPFGDTAYYVDRVTRTMEMYQRLYDF